MCQKQPHHLSDRYNTTLPDSITDLLMHLVQICAHLFREDIKDKFNHNKIIYLEHHNQTQHKPVLEKLARIFLHSVDKSFYPL